MKSACSRHPEQPAQWICPKCKLSFCAGCVITLDASTVGGKQVIRFCPKCMIAARPIGAVDAVRPFWKRLFTVSKAPSPRNEAPRRSRGSESDMDEKISELRGADKHKQALDQIRQWMKDGGTLTATLAGRYIDLLIKTGQTGELCNRATQMLRLLIPAGDSHRAIAVFDICHAQDSDGRIDPGILLKIGEILSANGRAKDAIRLYGVLAKNRPASPETPLAYFKAAQIYHERLMAPEKAKKILGQLIRRYPDHDMLPAFTSYLKKIGG